MAKKKNSKLDAFAGKEIEQVKKLKDLHECIPPWLFKMADAHAEIAKNLKSVGKKLETTARKSRRGK